MSSIQWSFDGLIRSMSLAISPTWRRTFEDTGQLPLVVVLGEGNWTGETAPFQPRTAAGVDPRWEDAIVVYVHPAALGDAPATFHSGHVGGSGMILAARDVTMLVGILARIRQTLEARYNERHPAAPITAASDDADRVFHPKQIHLFGFGQGAVLAYRLLAEQPFVDVDGVTYQFASMAVYGGTIGGYRGGRDVWPTPRYERRVEHHPRVTTPVDVEILHVHGEDDADFLPGTDHPPRTWHDGYGRGTPSAALAAELETAYPAADFVSAAFLNLTRCDYQIGHTVAPWYRYLMDALGGIAILPPPFALGSGIVHAAYAYVDVATDVWAADLSYDGSHRHFAIVIAGVGAEWPPTTVCDLPKLVLDFFDGTLTAL